MLTADQCVLVVECQSLDRHYVFRFREPEACEAWATALSAEAARRRASSAAELAPRDLTSIARSPPATPNRALSEPGAVLWLSGAAIRQVSLAPPVAAA